MNDLQFGFLGSIVFGIGIGNGPRIGVPESDERQPNGSAEQYESACHTATPHGVCHESWMAVGVAGQPILPQ